MRVRDNGAVQKLSLNIALYNRVEVMKMKVENSGNSFGIDSNATRRSRGKGSGSKNGAVSKSGISSKSGTNSGSGRISVKVGFNEAGTMARLANAKTRSQAAAIERSLRAQLKAAKQFESETSTIKAIKRAIGKAQFKIKALSKEERMRDSRKVAQSSGNDKEAKRIGRELKRKKRARKSKERADVMNSRFMVNDKDEDEKRKEDNNSVYSGYDYVCDGIDLANGTVPDVAGTEVDVLL